MKEMERCLIMIVLAFLALRCADETEIDAESKQYFSLKIDPSFLTTASDNWVVIHNKEGAILGFKQFESNQTYTFESEEELDEVNVTFVTFYQDNRGVFESYLGIMPGENWTLSTRIPESRGTGYDDLKVLFSTPGFSEFSLPWLSSYESCSGSIKTDTGYFLNHRYFPRGGDFLVVARDLDDRPIYRFVEGASVGEYTFSREDLQYFDNEITVNFPSTPWYYVETSAFKNDQAFQSSIGSIEGSFGFVLNRIDDRYKAAPERTSVSLGFTDKFPFYRTYFAVKYSGNAYGFESFGPGLTEDISFDTNLGGTVQDYSLEYFNISGSNYDRYAASWSFNTSGGSRTWSVIGQAGVFRNVTVLPEPIKQKYSDLAELIPAEKQLGIFYFDGDQSYADYIAFKFKYSSKPYFMNFKIGS